MRYIFSLNKVNDETIKSIGKFVCLWGIFEEKFFDCHFCVDKIDNFLIECQPNIESIKMLKNVVKKRINEFTINHYGYYDRSNNNISQFKAEIDNFLKNEIPTLKSTIYLIYRIRCNLCHGLKEIKELNNQYELFEAINKFFENLKQK